MKVIWQHWYRLQMPWCFLLLKNTVTTGISSYISRPLLSNRRKAATAKLWRRQCRQIFLECFGRFGFSIPIYRIHFTNASLIHEHEIGMKIFTEPNIISIWQQKTAGISWIKWRNSIKGFSRRCWNETNFIYKAACGIFQHIFTDKQKVPSFSGMLNKIRISSAEKMDL